jgi:TetR/AcrR family transcriptional repressor of nem operon
MRKGELTRKKIIETAAPVFNRLGFSRTSMSELMAATGLEKGGLYRHFESKEDLALESFNHAAELMEHAKFNRPLETRRPFQKLEEFVKTFANASSPIPGGCPVFNAAVEHDDGNPKLKSRARETYQKWTALLAEWVSEAQAARELNPKLKARNVAAYILCTLEGALIARNLMGSPEPLLAAEGALLDYLNSNRLPTRSLKNRKHV